MEMRGHEWNSPAAEKQAQPWDDLCAKASLGLEVQPDLTSSKDQRTTKRPVMKRKVLRHRPDGGVEVSDESVSSKPESNTKTWSMRNKTRLLRPDPEDSSAKGEIQTNSGSSSKSHHCGDRLHSLLTDFRSQSSVDSQDRAAVEQPKSFIPQRFEILGRNRGKTDSVAKYFEYKREWEKFKIPGEDQQLDVRQEIRQKMLCEPKLPHRPQHPVVLNTYTVPTEKKRAALCWKVRWDLAMGLLPRQPPTS